MHYVSDREAAMRDAKHAAGDKGVLVHGASIAQRALTAGCSTSSRPTWFLFCWAVGGGCVSTSASTSASRSGSGFSKETVA